MKYDVFISHASEDKEEIARPLATLLQARGLKVWLDEMNLTLGDSLRRNIDLGLTSSRFGLVILSPSFLSKEWPQKELDGLVARENDSTKVILPIWHKVSRDEIVKYSPILADGVDPLRWTSTGLILKPFRVLPRHARWHLRQHQTGLRDSFQSSGVRGSPGRCDGAVGCTSPQSR